MNKPADSLRLKVLVAGGLFIAFFALLVHFFVEWVKEEYDAGLSKEARKNPYYASILFLQEQGIESEMTFQRTLFNNLPKQDPTSFEYKMSSSKLSMDDTIIYIDGRGTLNEDRIARIQNWVNRGGTFIYSVVNPFISEETLFDDFSDQFNVELYNIYEEDDDTDNVFEEVVEDIAEEFDDIAAQNCFRTRPTHTVLEADGTELDVYVRSDIRIYDYGGESTNSEFQYQDNDILKHFARGKGNVYFFADPGLWRNFNVSCFDHAYLLSLMINPDGKVWFLWNRDSPSLVAIINRYTPIAAIFALLALISWIWLNLIRLGPVFHVDRSVRRSFAEHLRASGHFIWRAGSRDLLIDRLRGEVFARLKIKHRDFEIMAEADKITLIQSLTNLSPQTIEFALFIPVDQVRREFVDVVSTLKNMKEKL